MDTILGLSPGFSGVLGVMFLRISLGTFFTISGYHKLFNANRHATVLTTMQVDGVIDPRLNAWIIPLAEFSGGLAVAVGFLTPLAAAGLIIICCGATLLDGLKRITGMKPIDRADYVDDVLYLPEALYAIMLLTLIFLGSGPISVDHLLGI